jgi:hypothetical protein
MTIDLLFSKGDCPVKMKVLRSNLCEIGKTAGINNLSITHCQKFLLKKRKEKKGLVNGIPSVICLPVRRMY